MTRRAARMDVPTTASEAGLVELCTPAHILVLMAIELGKAGWELRPDVVRHLNQAAVVPLAGLDDLTVSWIAARVDRLGRGLLEALAPDDPRLGLITCALFTLKLVHEGLFPDPENQAVLASLLLTTEAREDDGAGWRFDEVRATAAADAMLVRARLLGHYLARPSAPAA